MFSKRNLKKELDQKLEASAPHLSQFEKPVAPRRNWRWLVPVTSIVGGLSVLCVGIALWNPFNSAASSNQQAAVASSAAATQDVTEATSQPGKGDSQTEATSAGSETDASGQSLNEANGYFPLSEETTALDHALRLKSHVSASDFEPRQVTFTLFPGFWDLSGTMSFMSEAGENSANGGKLLSSISNEAVLSVNGLSEKNYPDVWSSNALTINQVVPANQVTGYAYYRAKNTLVFDATTLANGQGELTCRFVLKGLEGYAHYDRTLKLAYTKSNTVFRFLS